MSYWSHAIMVLQCYSSIEWSLAATELPLECFCDHSWNCSQNHRFRMLQQQSSNGWLNPPFCPCFNVIFGVKMRFYPLFWPPENPNFPYFPSIVASVSHPPLPSLNSEASPPHPQKPSLRQFSGNCNPVVWL